MNTNCFNCRNTVHYMAPYSDFEPDEFNFSFLNVSGKFYFDHTGQIQIQCDNPVKVIFNSEFIDPNEEGILLNYSYSENLQRAFKSFTIVDELGTEYHFGGATAIEFSDPVSYGRNSNGHGIPATGELLQATSWFLTQIKSADEADIINFEYERGPFLCQLYRSFNYYSYSGAGMSGWMYNNIAKDGTLISPVYLKRIERENGEEITFTYTVSNNIKYSQNDYNSVFNTSSSDNYKLLERISAIPRFQPIAPSNKYERIQWLKLDTVSIKNTVHESLRQINFGYNNNPSERLFLELLNIQGNDTLASPVNYTFTYKNRNRLPSQYLNCITDHWGFNNGSPYPSGGFNSQNKAPNAYYTDSGVLSEIGYPTGGATQFEYELHDYAKVVDRKNRSVVTLQSGTASGLRIKKIITDSLIREFFYKETLTSSISSGVLNQLPQYNYSISGRDCDNKPFSKSVTRSMPIIPLTKDNEGLYIGYTYVCERVSGGNRGYTQYHYTNHDNGHPDSLLANGRWHRDIFPSDPHCSRYFERGRLKKETHYNSGGQATVINEIIWNRYGSQGEDNPRAFLFEGIKLGYDYCSSATYLHYCYKFLPYQKTETVYGVNGQNPVTTTTNYLYNSYNQIEEISVAISDGSVRRQLMKYPADFSYAPYSSMVTKNILSPVIENYQYKNTQFLKKEVTSYKLWHSKFYAPENKQVFYQNGAWDVPLKYDYDTKGNIREIIKNDADKTVYLWGYNHQYPIAEIKNASYSDIVPSKISEATLNAISAKSEPSSSDWNTIAGLRASLPNVLVTIYKYRPLVGMTEMIDPSGIKTTYEYDAFGRLQTVKDHNSNVLESYEYHYKN